MVADGLVGFHQGNLDGWLLGFLSAGAVLRWMRMGEAVVVADGWVWKMGEEEGFC